MEIEDRLKIYLNFADVSRRWTSIMDAKAAFLSALNGGLLAFLWGSILILNMTQTHQEYHFQVPDFFYLLLNRSA